MKGDEYRLDCQQIGHISAVRVHIRDDRMPIVSSKMTAKRDGANRASILEAIKRSPNSNYKEIERISGVPSQIVRTQLTYLHDQGLVRRDGKKGNYRYWIAP